MKCRAITSRNHVRFEQEGNTEQGKSDDYRPELLHIPPSKYVSMGSNGSKVTKSSSGSPRSATSSPRSSRTSSPRSAWQESSSGVGTSDAANGSDIEVSVDIQSGCSTEAPAVVVNKGEVIYSGTRTFWRAHCMMDIIIVHHSYCSTADGSSILEMICYEPENDMELPRIYVHYDNCKQRLSATAVDEETKKRKEVFLRQKKTYDAISIHREARLYVASQFLLVRLDVRELFGSKGIFQVALNPQMGDLNEENIEKNDFLFCKRPEDLIPHHISRSTHIAKSTMLSAAEVKVEQRQEEERKQRLEILTMEDFQNTLRLRKEGEAGLNPVRAAVRRGIHRLVLLLRIERMEQRVLRSHVCDWYRKFHLKSHKLSIASIVQINPMPLVALAVVKFLTPVIAKAADEIESEVKNDKKSKFGLHKGEHLPILLAMQAKNQQASVGDGKITPEHRRSRSAADAIDSAAFNQQDDGAIHNRTPRRTLHVPSITPPSSPFHAQGRQEQKRSIFSDHAKSPTNLRPRSATFNTCGIASNKETGESKISAVRDRWTDKRNAAKMPATTEQNLSATTEVLDDSERNVNTGSSNRLARRQLTEGDTTQLLPEISAAQAMDVPNSSECQQFSFLRIAPSERLPSNRAGHEKKRPASANSLGRRERAVTVDSVQSLQRRNVRHPDDFCQRENETSRYCYYPPSVQRTTDGRSGHLSNDSPSIEDKTYIKWSPKAKKSKPPQTAANVGITKKKADPVTSLQESFVNRISDMQQNVPLHSFAQQHGHWKAAARVPPASPTSKASGSRTSVLPNTQL